MSILPIDRKEQLEKVNETIVNSRKKLSAIVSSIGWSIESLSKDVENIVTCPFDGSHNVPENSLEKHLRTCQWKAEGYGVLDLPLSSPSLPPGAPSCIKFDEQLQDDVIQRAKEKDPSMVIGASGRLIPRTSDRFVAEFTRQEKCAMYEYVIANTVEPDIGKDIADMNKPKASGNGKTSSYLELLAQERNLKRRRAKYRGVHTNKKSQIEILREVINQQMEMVSEYITEQNHDTSDFVTNNLLPKEDVRGYHEINMTAEIEHSHAASSSHSTASQTFSNTNHRAHYQENCSKNSEDLFLLRASANDRGRSKDSRDCYGKTDQSMGINHYSKERDQSNRRECDSDEQKSHKSYRKTHRENSNYHQKKRKKTKSCQRERSRERKRSRQRERSRERKRSRERELSRRSSRDPKYRSQRSESVRYLQYDERRKKKREES